MCVCVKRLDHAVLQEASQTVAHLTPHLFFSLPPDFLDEMEICDKRASFFSVSYFSTSAFFLDIVLPPKCSPLNQCIHKEPQTLMAIIMLISSTLRCGFNISFRGTCLDSCKLCASGGPRANIKYFMSHSFHSICVCVRQRRADVLYNYQIKMQAKTFHAPFNLYTNTAKSCTSALHLG